MVRPIKCSLPTLECEEHLKESKHCLETQPSCHLGWVSGNLSPCCQSHKPLYEIDHRQVMALGLTVICTCLVLTVTIVICCFWSRCPLYNTCRVNYTQGHIIAYSKEDDPFNSIMQPNPVKIKPVEDV
ncbi:uncharacterized protein LOC110831903 isoform X2 [Zootermopsis nevadensis]|uniref:uncharacterized protein LOC110831903 isoform X2 n=1 Tax=Zootermopsis nevadensis TaxID=136037 RepID=UPI000B8EB47A|nr:uncharacterized protein LOC110831903 isoform X2 [Zootermopsis nevadensis]